MTGFRARPLTLGPGPDHDRRSRGSNPPSTLSQVGSLANGSSSGGGMSTESTPTLSIPPGVPEAEFEALLITGKQRGVLTADDLMTALEDVELSPELIDGVRERLATEGIKLDEEADVDEDEEEEDEDEQEPPLDASPVVTEPTPAA